LSNIGGIHWFGPGGSGISYPDGGNRATARPPSASCRTWRRAYAGNLGGGNNPLVSLLGGGQPHAGGVLGGGLAAIIHSLLGGCLPMLAAWPLPATLLLMGAGRTMPSVLSVLRLRLLGLRRHLRARTTRRSSTGRWASPTMRLSCGSRIIPKRCARDTFLTG
jgi:hypothetical protein